jgi:hypothetical protein
MVITASVGHLASLPGKCGHLLWGCGSGEGRAGILGKTGISGAHHLCALDLPSPSREAEIRLAFPFYTGDVI